jgi:hypothetical protein
MPRPRRHRELSPEVEHTLVEWIAKKVYDNKALNRTELLSCCIANFGTPITRRWADSFLSRHAAEPFERKVIPKKIKDLKCHTSSLRLQLKAYESMYMIRVQSLFLISRKLDSVNGRIGLKEK